MNHQQIPSVEATPVNPAPLSKTILVQVPSGAQPGQILQLVVNNRTLQVQVPSGGVTQFYVSLPDDAAQIPVVPAQPISSNSQVSVTKSQSSSQGCGSGNTRPSYVEHHNYHGYGGHHGYGGYHGHGGHHGGCVVS